MLNQQTLHKLYIMRLNGMADAFRQQLEKADLAGFSFEERFGLLVDRQWSWKEDRALARRLRNRRREELARSRPGAQSMPGRLYGVLRSRRTTVSRTGAGSRRRQLQPSATPAGANRPAGHRRLGHGAAERRRTQRFSGDLRRPLSNPFHYSDLAGAGVQLACADR